MRIFFLLFESIYAGNTYISAIINYCVILVFECILYLNYYWNNFCFNS